MALQIRSKCGKVPFETREAAMQRKSEIKGMLNVYQCTECGKWHLTKMTKTQYKDGVVNLGFATNRLKSAAIRLAKKKGWIDDED